MRNRRSNKGLDKIGAGLAINGLIQEGKLNANEAMNMLDKIGQDIEYKSPSELSKEVEELYVIGFDCYKPTHVDTISMFFDSLRYSIQQDNLKSALHQVQTDFPELSTIRNKNPYLGEWYYYIKEHKNEGSCIWTTIINPLGYSEALPVEALYNSYERIQEEDISIYDKVHLIGKFVDSLGMVLDCLPKDKYEK